MKDTLAHLAAWDRRSRQVFPTRVRLNPLGAGEAELKKRTLTNLYNQRPTWLDLAHRNIDRAVLDAYGWPHDLTDDIFRRDCWRLILSGQRGKVINTMHCNLQYLRKFI